MQVKNANENANENENENENKNVIYISSIHWSDNLKNDKSKKKLRFLVF